MLSLLNRGLNQRKLSYPNSLSNALIFGNGLMSFIARAMVWLHRLKQKRSLICAG